MEMEEKGYAPPPETGLAENLDHCYAENFSKIYSRGGLALRKRLLCAISSLVAQGDLLLLEKHFRFALENKISLSEICETLLQTYLFIGFPGAYKSFDLLARVSGPERPAGASPFNRTQEERMGDGEKLCQKVYGENYEKLRRNISELDPDFARWMISEGYGKVLSRPELDPGTRELVTVAALVVKGQERQLRSHLKGAMNLGCTPGEVREVILQTYLYAGFPSIIDALIVFREVQNRING